MASLHPPEQICDIGTVGYYPLMRRFKSPLLGAGAGGERWRWSLAARARCYF